MPRSLVLGNGNLLTTFDEHLLLRDLYFPYVGEEDHTTYGHKHRIGVLIEGEEFSWLDDGNWHIEPLYEKDTLTGSSRITNSKLEIEITARDFVHSVKNILMRRFTVRSQRNQKRTMKMYFHHDIHPYGDKQKDTSFYEPASNTVIHYRKKRYFLIGGQAGNQGITSYTTGKSEYRDLEGTWRDAEDGHLEQNPIEQGSVDSTVELTATLEPGKDELFEMWLCAGKSLSTVLNLHDFIHEETTERMERSTRQYWQSWAYKTKRTYGTLNDSIVNLFKRSLLIVRTQADNRGGILAANDSDIMRFNRDTYTYVWPRDGAFICMAMDDAGYYEMTRRFFAFCSNAISDHGYMLHKYNPDGSPGSSWHPWFKNGEMQLPIQEDETALVLAAMWHHFEKFNDFEWLQETYEKFVRTAGNFLVSYREHETGLPLASYDPWEEQHGIFSYTAATTYAGLRAAANICEALGHVTHYERYHEAADKMHAAILKHLYDKDLGRFVKRIIRKNGEETLRDPTPDASIMLLWKLDLLPPDDERIASTMNQLIEALHVNTDVGGYARYPNDTYHWHSGEHTSDVPGNPWIITTLWVAQWRIAMAQSLDDLQEPLQTLDWVVSKATPAGILPEQLDPYSGEHLSVAPLTWSHAVYVETVLMYLEKEKNLQ